MTRLKFLKKVKKFYEKIDRVNDFYYKNSSINEKELLDFEASVRVREALKDIIKNLDDFINFEIKRRKK